MSLFLDTDSRIVEYWHRDDIGKLDKVWVGSKAGHHAHYGAKRAALLKDSAGVVRLFLPSEANNFASIPDFAGLDDIDEDMVLFVKVQAEDWDFTGGASIKILVARWETSGDKYSWFLALTAAGAPRLYWHDGSSENALTCDTNVDDYGIADGTSFWLGVSMDGDNDAGDADVKFWDGGTGDEPSDTPTQIGSTENEGATTSIQPGSSQIEIGTRLNGSDTYSFDHYGGIYGVRLWSDLARSAELLDIDFTAQEEGTESFEEDAGSHTVTINASGATANDPSNRLVDDGLQYYRNNGVAGNVIRSSAVEPDALTADTWGFITHFIPSDGWRPASSTESPIARSSYDRIWVGTAGTVTYRLFLTDGAGGHNAYTLTSTESVPDDDLPRSIKFEYTASTGTMVFYTSTDVLTDPDDAGWAQLGDPVTTGDTAKQAYARNISIGAGSTGGSGPFDGKIYTALVLQDGEVVMGLDFTDTDTVGAGETSQSDPYLSGVSWTFDRSASGMVGDIIEHNEIQGSTDDILLVPYHADLESDEEDLVYGLIWRSSLDGTTQILMGNRLNSAAGSPGLLVGIASSDRIWTENSNGTTEGNDNITGSIAGDLVRRMLAGQRDDSEDELEAFLDGSGSGGPATTPTGSITSSEDLSFLQGADGVTNAASGFICGAFVAKPAGVNFDSTEWASILSELTNTRAPDAPSLLQPDDEVAGNQSTPHFTWSSPDYAEGYEIEIATDTGFASIVEEDDTIDVAEFMSSLGLDEDVYYWRVRAKNRVNEWGDFAAYREFTVQAVPDSILQEDDRVVEYWHRDDFGSIPLVLKAGKAGNHGYYGKLRSAIVPDAAGVNSAYVPKSGLAAVITQDAIGNDINGDEAGTMRIEFAFEDWTPSASMYPMIFGAGPGYIGLTTAGGFGALWTFDSGVVGAGVTAPSLDPWDRIQVRVDFDGNDGAGNRTVSLYYRTDTSKALSDDTGWTLGSGPTATAGTGVTALGADRKLYLSYSHGAEPYRVYKAYLETDGTTHVDTDFTSLDAQALYGLEFDDDAGQTFETTGGSGASANDPSDRLVTDGKQYLRCNGVDGNYVRLSDNSVDLTTVSTFGIIGRCSDGNWRPASGASFGAWTGYDNYLLLKTSGLLSVRLELTDGNSTKDSTEAVPEDEGYVWARYLYDTATSLLTFQVAKDTTYDPALVTGWEQLGDPVASGLTGTALANNDAIIAVYHSDGQNPYDGDLFGVWFEMGGTIVNGLDFTDTDNVGPGDATCPDAIDPAKTWTFTRSSSGLVMDVISGNEIQGSTDDIILVSHKTDLGSDGEDLVYFALFRSSISLNGWIMGKRTSTATAAEGLHLGTIASNNRLWAEASDGLAEATDIHFEDTAGSLETAGAAAQWDESRTQAKIIKDGVGSGSPGEVVLGTLAGTDDLSFFNIESISYPGEGFLLGAAVIKPGGLELTADEWAALFTGLSEELSSVIPFKPNGVGLGIGVGV